jgi:hypothetical protein
MRLEPSLRNMTVRLAGFCLTGGLLFMAACASTQSQAPVATPPATPEATPATPTPTAPAAANPSADSRVGLRAGLMDAQEAVSNLKVLAKAAPPKEFVGAMNSDLSFTGNYAIQGNFNGFQVWDISNPSQPTLVKGFLCPASQSDVSVYKNLLFVSGENNAARLDCGTQGVQGPVSAERFRGIRIFDITDIKNPKYITSVQTCRGSHTHTVLEDPKDAANVYIYVSGSAPVRRPEEMAGCSNLSPKEDPNSALFRIEVIRVPVANPAQSRIVSSPRIFNDLVEPKSHGLAPADEAVLDRARARGAFIVDILGQQEIVPDQYSRVWLDSIVRSRGGRGAPTRADSAALRAGLPAIVARMIGPQPESGPGPRPGPTQCHDITVYPAVGLAGGACEGYGLLLDISDPVNPKRIAAVADSNFAYWHSATFNNDGTKILFSDEWGGGGGPKCRADDPKEWGANAIFSIENRQMNFKSYYKLSAPQTPQENCVAHNGSMIPIPGRDVMVQAWYQGGISVFDFTDAANPKEIAYHDRGPVNASEMTMGGSWSVYWYNGAIVSSEIARGLDVFALTPSEHLSQNEIDAANSIKLTYLNTQGQPKFEWPPTFALARAFVDQLERSKCMSATRIAAVRSELSSAENAPASSRQNSLSRLASQLDGEAGSSCDAPKMRMLSKAVRDLAVTAD